jgi:streptomycin 6-kinase
MTEGKGRRSVSIPAVLRRKAVAVGAEHWLDELAALVTRLEQQWDIAVGRSYDLGSEAYVAEATTSDGRAVVMKLVVPRDADAARNEITALQLADGHGCAALLRADADLGALLLERLGPPMFELGIPIERRHEILCDTVAQMWRAAPGCPLPSGADKARWLASFISSRWEKLDRPCSRKAVDHALECARRRELAHDDERAVLVHGDVHQLNALQHGDGFKLVDPDGLLAEPELDLGVLMRGDPVELLEGDPRARARWLAARSGLDATAIWEWGVVERVSTALHCEEIDVQPLGRETLAAAEAVAGIDME